MVTIVVWHHKHMKLFKPFTPRVIAWSVRNSGVASPKTWDGPKYLILGE